ncbi:MAG: thiamine-phosphate kinase [Gammaproteobacteria bacterium]
MSEQALIQKYFSRHQAVCENIEVSVGDDAAIVCPPSNRKLVVTTDTLNAGIHFYSDCKPEYIGHKSLAVNLSDIAAMGAKPLWATLSLSLPDINHDWLEKFSNSFYALADQYDLKLIGGDTVKGPLSITIQIIGSVEHKQELLRCNCEVDDLIYVSGFIGDAAFGLKVLQKNYNIDISSKDKDYFLKKLYMPKPRLDVSRNINSYAHAAIDISDGFIIDLQRILTASNKGAVISLNEIPVSNPMKKLIKNETDMKELLIGGEDYELIFSINKNDKNKLEAYAENENIVLTEVGKIVKGSEISLFNNGVDIKIPNHIGFDHF